MTQPQPPTPIRPDLVTDLSTSPEALMISALLATGTFIPSEYGLSSEDLSCYEQLWTFATHYQAKTGAAPTLELITGKFPDYRFVPGIDPQWASEQLHDAAYGRHIRITLRDVLQSVGAGDYATVHEILRGLGAPRRTTALHGLNVFNPLTVGESAIKTGIPVPWRTLQEMTGGIGLNELWNVAGYAKAGKSWVGAVLAGYAAEHGYTVKVVSLEMPAAAWNRRLARYFARNDRAAQVALKDHDQLVREEALERLRAGVPGTIETIDMAAADINLATIGNVVQGAHIVMIDHVGLLKLPDGTRPVDDWRLMAKASNVLRELNLATGVAMVNLVQTNNNDGRRQGMTPPKLSDFGGSLALAQDCDIAVTIKKPAPTFQVHGIEANREGSSGRYYIKYDPEHADYREITKEEALNYKLADDNDNAT